MLTMAEADVLIGILSTVFVFTMLGAFTGALFLNKFRRELAILTGVSAALLLVVMGIALSAPFIFTP